MVGFEERAMAGREWLVLCLKQLENLWNYLTLNHINVTLIKAPNRGEKTHKKQRKKKGGGDVSSDLIQDTSYSLSSP